MTRGVAFVVAVGIAVSGCSSPGNTLRTLFGVPAPGEPTALTSAEPRWLLIKNPRFGDVPSEPEYIWVEEDKIPTTFATLFRGKRAIIAPPEVVAKYGSPPGGGRISPRQGVPYQAAAAEPKVAATTREPARPAPAAPEAKRGYVVYVDTTRIVIDLIGSDGVRAGSTVSLRRDRIPVVHPITGEVLGELDEEVGTARVTEIRDKFSVAEIQTVAPGDRIQVRDRVVVK